MTRVLVIEDEESFRDALKFMLSREGFDVTLASNGAEGMKLFDSPGLGTTRFDVARSFGHRGM